MAGMFATRQSRQPMQSLLPAMVIEIGGRSGSVSGLPEYRGRHLSGDPNKTAKYQDIVEIVSGDHRILYSQVLGEDGRWNRFMTAHYRRTK